MHLKEILVCYKILSKARNKQINIKKQVSHSILLRAPKHFNIGKHKIKNLNYKYSNVYKLNLLIKVPLFLHNIANIIGLAQKIITKNTLFLINSHQCTVCTKFKVFF